MRRKRLTTFVVVAIAFGVLFWRYQAQLDDDDALQTAFERPLIDGSWKRPKRHERDPLNPLQELKYDAGLRWIDGDAKRGWVVTAGTMFNLTFECTHSSIKDRCPSSYRVLADGPTMASSSWTNSSERLSPTLVRVHLTVHDPGQYWLYAWPEHEGCDAWTTLNLPYNKLAVRDSPVSLIVEGSPSRDLAEICSSTDAINLDGRWIRKDAIATAHTRSLTSHFWWSHRLSVPVSTDEHATLYEHTFAPYNCKLAQQTLYEWVELVKPRSLLAIGDSVLRDPFCLILHKNLRQGAKIDSQCHWSDSAEYHTSNKQLQHVRADGNTTDVTFHWNPQGDTDVLADFLRSLRQPPSHVYLSIALWLAKMDVDEYVAIIDSFLQKLTASVPDDTQIVVRSSAGVVQQIQCYDRIGGQRSHLEPLNAALAELVAQYPRVNFMPLYPLFDSQPGSTPDGRHWGAQGHTYDARPAMGIVEHHFFQALFHSWWRAQIEDLNISSMDP
ncbi:hypothetical protein ACM66B_003270 [Microbotryomycetes sp. NB124-2]